MGNIHSCVGVDGQYSVSRVAAVIKDLMADVVAIQEADVNRASQQTRRWSSKHCDDQVADLARLSGLEHHSFASAMAVVVQAGCCVNFEKHDCGDGEFGIAVLSRYPIMEQ